MLSMKIPTFLRNILVVFGLLSTVAVAPVASAAGNGCAILPVDCSSTAAQSGDNVKDTNIYKLLVYGINILTAGIGLAAVGVIVYAGILYTSAGGSNEQVAKAKELITNTVIGLVAYALMYFALNWLIPGGAIG